MTIVSDIVKQMPAVRQPQRKFLAVLFATILALRGRVTFRNLSRYCAYSERTMARQFRASFAWPDFHQRVITAALALRNGRPAMREVNSSAPHLWPIWPGSFRWSRGLGLP